MNRSECDESMMMDFNKGVDVTKAARVCACLGSWSMNLREDINKEIVTIAKVRSQ